MSLTTRALAALALMLIAACSRPLSVRLDVTVRDDAGRPLAGRPVEVDSVRVATSDVAGRAHATIHASRAGRIAVSVGCPEGTRPPPARSLPLGGDTPRLQVDLVCRPGVRTLVVAVRAPAAVGAVLRADGEPLGRVDSDGTLHAVITRPPDSELRLSLDTSAAPQLRPQHPARDVHVADRDELIVFDQGFEQATPKRKRRAYAAPAPRTELPYAIRAQR